MKLIRSMSLFVTLAALSLHLTASRDHAPVSAQAQTTSAVVRVDPALDAIVSVNARVEPLKQDYFGITEGPLWVQEGASGYLLFSDVGGNTMYKWTPDGTLSVFLERAGYTGSDISSVGNIVNNGRLNVATSGPNGIARDPQGRFVFSAMGDRAIVRLENDGRRTVLADRYEGKRLNGTNDLVIRSDGAIYFTDPRPGCGAGTTVLTESWISEASSSSRTAGCSSSPAIRREHLRTASPCRLTRSTCMSMVARRSPVMKCEPTGRSRIRGCSSI